MKYNISYPTIALICLVLSAIVFYLLFGVMGLLILGGIILFYCLPILLIFNQLPLDPDEKFFFGFFLSFVFFPMLIWYIDRVLDSFRWSIGVSLIVITLVGIMLRIRTK